MTRHRGTDIPLGLLALVLAASAGFALAACGRTVSQGTASQGHPLRAGALAVTVDWSLGSRPASGYCSARLAVVVSPVHAANTGPGKVARRLIGTSLSGVPAQTQPDGTTHCAFHTPVVSDLRMGMWAITASTSELPQWSATCRRVLSDEVASATFEVGTSKCS